MALLGRALIFVLAFALKRALASEPTQTSMIEGDLSDDSEVEVSVLTAEVLDDQLVRQPQHDSAEQLASFRPRNP